MQELITSIITALLLCPLPQGHCSSRHWTCKERITEFSLYFYEEAYDNTPITPKVLAAVAFHESRMNPGAKSKTGDLGIMQLNPKFHRNLRFVRDERYRKFCVKHRLGACQRPVVRAASKILHNSYRKCGSLRRALQKYHTGSCWRGPDYSRKVLRRYKKL